jgi:bisphosphoglycerate-independent phosphoglycerate mutase (AlkP superfamily)
VSTVPPAIRVVAGRNSSLDPPPFPGHGRYRPDVETRHEAIEHLRRHQPRFLWVALGDTDEWAHRGDYRGYLEALRAADRFVGEIAEHLAQMRSYGARTAIFVTTDHGRGPAFEDHGDAPSQDVWLLARGAGIAVAGSKGTAEPRYLRDLAPTVRALVGLPAGSCDGDCGSPIHELMAPAPDGRSP